LRSLCFFRSPWSDGPTPSQNKKRFQTTVMSARMQLRQRTLKGRIRRQSRGSDRQCGSIASAAKRPMKESSRRFVGVGCCRSAAPCGDIGRVRMSRAGYLRFAIWSLGTDTSTFLFRRSRQTRSYLWDNFGVRSHSVHRDGVIILGLAVGGESLTVLTRILTPRNHKCVSVLSAGA